MESEDDDNGIKNMLLGRPPCPYVELYLANQHIGPIEENYFQVKEAGRRLEMHEREIRKMRQDLTEFLIQRGYETLLLKHKRHSS
jgi:hypothetical protein